MRSRYPYSRACGVAFALLFVACPARAVTTTWTRGAGSDLWNNNANWSASQPTLSVDALFPAPFPGSSYVVLGFAEQAASLTFNAVYHLDAQDFASASITLGGAGSVAVNNGVGVLLDVPLAGSAGLTKSGNGILFLDRPNTFTNGVFVNGGTLAVAANNQFGNASNGVSLNAGTLNTRATFSTPRDLTIGVFGGTVDVNDDTTFTMTGGILGNPNPLTKKGDGAWHLNKASARSATATIEAGVVRLNNAAGLGSGPIILKTTGTLEIPAATNVVNGVFLQEGGVIRSGGGFAVFGGPCIVSTGADAVYLNGGAAPADTLRIGNAIPNTYTGGADTTTVVTGAGRVQLLLGNDYAGDWRIDSGTLTFFNPGSLGSGTSPVVVNAGTLELQGSFARAITLNHNATLAAFEGASPTAPVAVAPAAAATIALRTGGFPETPIFLGDSPNDLTGGANGASIAVTGVANGPTLHLQHANDYAGAWSISSFAKVRIAHSAALGTGASAVNLTNGLTPNGGTLELDNVTLARGVDVRNGATLRGIGAAAAVTGPVTFNLFGNVALSTPAADDTLVLSGALNGSGGNWTKSGAGTVRLTGPQSHPAGTTLFIDAGMLELFSPAGAPAARTLSVSIDAGALRMNQTQHLKGLTVGGNLAILDAPTPAVLQTEALSIGAGKLDLTNDKLIVVNGDLANIAAKVSSGFNTGAWTGPGIVTTVATSNTGLGVSRAAEAGLAGGTFAGVPVAAADVLVAYTLLGDATLDAAVDFNDLVRLAQNYNTAGKGWWQGDFTYDGSVDFNDLVKLAQNYNTTLAAAPVPGAPAGFDADFRAALAQVPEPAALPVATAALLLCRRRRRPVVRPER